MLCHSEIETEGRKEKTTATRKGCKLTASIFVAVVPAVIISIALPLGRDAGTLPECTDRTCEVVPPTRTLSAALNSCKHTEEEVRA